MLWPEKKYPVVLADPPWMYYGDPNKDQAAGKHYGSMTIEELSNLPIRDIMEDRSILFIWVTSPKISEAVQLIDHWGLYYRGIAFDWVKTNKSGNPINGQGIRPSLIKHAGELVFWASPVKTGRSLPIKSESVASWILEKRPQDARGNIIHSAKPETIQDRIEQLVDGPYCELFARRHRPGWDCFGLEVDGGT